MRSSLNTCRVQGEERGQEVWSMTTPVSWGEGIKANQAGVAAEVSVASLHHTMLHPPPNFPAPTCGDGTERAG